MSLKKLLVFGGLGVAAYVLYCRYMKTTPGTVGQAPVSTTVPRTDTV